MNKIAVFKVVVLMLGVQTAWASSECHEFYNGLRDMNAVAAGDHMDGSRLTRMAEASAYLDGFIGGYNQGTMWGKDLDLMSKIRKICVPQEVRVTTSRKLVYFIETHKTKMDDSDCSIDPFLWGLLMNTYPCSWNPSQK